MKSIIFLNLLMLQKQVHTLPVDHSNNEDKIEDKIMLLIISICNTTFSKFQSNISSNNSKMSNYSENSLVESHGSDISGHFVVVILVK